MLEAADALSLSSLADFAQNVATKVAVSGPAIDLYMEQIDKARIEAEAAIARGDHQAVEFTIAAIEAVMNEVMSATSGDPGLQKKMAPVVSKAKKAIFAIRLSIFKLKYWRHLAIAGAVTGAAFWYNKKYGAYALAASSLYIGALAYKDFK